MGWLIINDVLPLEPKKEECLTVDSSLAAVIDRGNLVLVSLKISSLSYFPKN